MLVKSSLALFSLAVSVAGSPRHRQSVLSHGLSDDDCPKAMIFGVRGTLEKPGVGAMKDLMDELMKRIPGSEGFGVDYPAAGITIGEDGKPDYDIFSYSGSKTMGGDTLRFQSAVFNNNCPDTPIVLMGYSQGAHVVGDAVCGVGPGIWPLRPRMDQSVRDKIAAIVQFGDPTNDAAMPWHRGTSENSGLFPRLYWRSCTDMSDKWRSYCDKKDPFCSRGMSYDAHAHYATDYFDDVVDFVVGKVKATGVHCKMGHEL